jgi:hypothetical protein
VILDNVRRSAFLLVALAGGSAAAQSQSTGRQPAGADEARRAIAVWASRAESDNMGRSEDGARGTYNGLGFLFDLAHAAARLDSSLYTNLELRQYSDETIDDDPVGTLDGLLSFDLMPERVIWDVRDSYGQGTLDPFAAIGPDNRESINVFATGPRFQLPLGGRFELSAGGSYSSRRFDDSDQLDSDATVYDLGLFRQTSETTRFGLVLTTNEVEYDVPSAPRYDIDRASLRYERSLATGAVIVDVGKNEISYPGGATDEPSYSFEWNRNLATRSRLRVAATRLFTDAGTALSSDLSGDLDGSDTGILVTASPFEQEGLFVGYSLAGARTSVSLDLGFTEESYVGAVSLDNDNTTTHALLRRTVSSRLAVGLEYSGNERAFVATDTEPARDETDRTLSAWINHSFGRLFDVALVLTSYEREGTVELKEDRYEIRFTYSPSDSGAVALGAAGR